VHDSAANNLVFDWAFGDTDKTNAAFTNAAHITKLELINNRVIVNAMEPRAVLADYDSSSAKMTVYTCTQGGWPLKSFLATVLNTNADNVRVITPDVGGGFGMKAMIYPELALAAVASRKIGRPVKWNGERGESFLADTMGRDHVTTAELAFDSNHSITGMRVETISNMGAYLSLFAPFIPTMAALKVLPGVYDVKNLYYRVLGVFTHTTPVDAYRGAGRPESIYVVERLIEKAARELGVDPAELRRKNFIPGAAMPFTTTAGEIYDTGEFAQVMDKALQQADWAGLAARREASRKNGKRRGIGMCYYIESTMGDPLEKAAVRFTADGSVDVLVGTQSNGQGHETAYAQILNQKLGVPFDKIRVVQGDTDLIPYGGGTGGSRSVTAEGWAISDAATADIERGKHYAAQELEAAVADIEFAVDEGQFRITGTDRSIDIMSLAQKARASTHPPAGFEGGLDADAAIEVKAWTFPNGCHIAEVEIDEETGVTEVVKYSVVDDFGVLINPLLVEGQVHGGVVQGLGQALMEHTVFDDNGQLLSGSFMDYCMPRADNMPSISFSNVEVPCKNNPLGMKGCGEAGSVGSCASVINAIIDALSDIGVDQVDMPATPQTIWRLLQQQKAA
jgi:carbon-monoxide dehydrogenase large subunit